MIVAAAVKHPHILAVPSGPAANSGSSARKASFSYWAYWVLGTAGYSSEVHFLVWDTLKAAGIPLAPAK